MRVIKFRAWDSQNKEMLVTPLESCFSLSRFFGFLHDDMHIMQFTGLEDKNGKEIYEGDILKYTNRKNHHCEFEQYFSVEFDKLDLGNDIYSQTIGWGVKCPGLDMDQGILSLFGTHNVEVVGNIHENPELLEGSNENHTS